MLVAQGLALLKGRTEDLPVFASDELVTAPEPSVRSESWASWSRRTYLRMSIARWLGVHESLLVLFAVALAC